MYCTDTHRSCIHMLYVHLLAMIVPSRLNYLKRSLNVISMFFFLYDQLFDSMHRIVE
jgi:hypothetical protein